MVIKSIKIVLLVGIISLWAGCGKLPDIELPEDDQAYTTFTKVLTSRVELLDSARREQALAHLQGNLLAPAPGISPSPSPEATLLTLPTTPMVYSSRPHERLFRDISEDRLLTRKTRPCASQAPTTVIRYENKKRGIRFHFPHNPLWLVPQDMKAPVIQPIQVGTRDVTQFGPIGSFDGCVVPQMYFFEFMPAISSDALVEKLKQATWHHYQPKKVDFGQLEAVTYRSPGLCERPAVQVIGPSFNMKFEPLCGSDDERLMLDEIVRTLEFLPEES